MTLMPVHCILAVWGEAYTDLFLKYSLPSQLAAGNIPYLRDNPNARYKIFTTENDMAAMRRDAVFQRLESMIRVVFIPITIDPGNKFFSLSDCHNASIKDADREDAALIFLSPDFILARGCFAYGMRQWASGFNVVYTLTPRLVRKSALEELDAIRGQEDIDLPADDLGDIALRHLHPIERGYFYKESLVSFPIHVYWQVKNEGFIAHCAYLHPLFVNPLEKGERPVITIDADYVDRCCPDLGRIHVVDDSSKMLCVELSPEALTDINSQERGNGFPATPQRFARWAATNANPVFGSVQHHWLLQHAIRVHGRTVTTDAWHNVERAAYRFMRSVRLYTMAYRHGFRRIWRMPAFWSNTRVPYKPIRSLLLTERALEQHAQALFYRSLERLGITRRRVKATKRFSRFAWKNSIRLLRKFDFLSRGIDAIKEWRISQVKHPQYRAELAFLHARDLFFRKQYAKAFEWHSKALPGIRTLRYKRVIMVIIAELDALPSDIRTIATSRYWAAVHKIYPRALGSCILLARELLREGRPEEALAVWEEGLNAEMPGTRTQWYAARKTYLGL